MAASDSLGRAYAWFYAVFAACAGAILAVLIIASIRGDASWWSVPLISAGAGAVTWGLAVTSPGLRWLIITASGFVNHWLPKRWSRALPHWVRLPLPGIAIGAVVAALRVGLSCVDAMPSYWWVLGGAVAVPALAGITVLVARKVAT